MVSWDEFKGIQWSNSGTKIDEYLCELNDDYKVERASALKEICVKTYPPTVFYDWMKNMASTEHRPNFPCFEQGLAWEMERVYRLHWNLKQPSHGFISFDIQRSVVRIYSSFPYRSGVFALIRLSLEKGVRPASIFAAGTAASDILALGLAYFLIAGFSENPHYKSILGWTGGIIMIIFGIVDIIKNRSSPLAIRFYPIDGIHYS